MEVWVIHGYYIRRFGEDGHGEEGAFLFWAADFLRTALALMDGALEKSGIYVANLPHFEWWFLVKVDFA